MPESYRIAIVPDISALTLSGTESVSVRFRTSTDTLELNSLNETLANVRLDGVPVAAVDSNNAQELSTITLVHAAAAGLHTLSFDYHGKIETRPQGLYAQPYAYPDGASGVMLDQW